MKEYEIVSKTNGRYPMPSAIYIFRNGLLTDFVCLYTYEFWLSLCKIVRSSVILLLPLLASHDGDRKRFIVMTYDFNVPARNLSCYKGSKPLSKKSWHEPQILEQRHSDRNHKIWSKDILTGTTRSGAKTSWQEPQDLEQRHPDKNYKIWSKDILTGTTRSGANTSWQEPQDLEQIHPDRNHKIRSRISA